MLQWIQQSANNWLRVGFHVYLHFNSWVTLEQRPFILHNSVVIWTFSTIQKHPVDRWLQHNILSCLAQGRLIIFFFFNKKKRGSVIYQRELGGYLYKTHFSWLSYWFTAGQLPDKENKHYSALSSYSLKSQLGTIQLNHFSMFVAVNWKCCQMLLGCCCCPNSYHMLKNKSSSKVKLPLGKRTCVTNYNMNGDKNIMFLFVWRLKNARNTMFNSALFKWSNIYLCFNSVNCSIFRAVSRK